MKKSKPSCPSESWNRLIGFEKDLLPSIYDSPITCKVIATHPFFPFRGPKEEQSRSLKWVARKRTLPASLRHHFEGCLIRRILKALGWLDALEAHKKLTFEIFKEHERLVFFMLRERGDFCGALLDELRQNGALVLLRCIDRYWPSRDHPFYSYLRTAVRGVIFSTVKEYLFPFSLSHSDFKSFAETSEVEDFFTLCLSLDAPLGDKGRVTLHERLPSSVWTPHSERLRNGFVEALGKVLDKRRVDILCRYFGLRGFRPHTLAEIGKIYGLSRERVRQLLESALRKLRSEEGRRLLDNFYW